jgi:TetR/AcrR family transcriptional repressor of nem operon
LVYIQGVTIDVERRRPGRPREFVPDDVVRRAMDVFRVNGYTDTSLTDLIEGTGLSRGSLYKAFGDKRSLFLAALDVYMADNIEQLDRNLAAAPGTAGIRAALVVMAGACALDAGLLGCMVVASTTELAARDEEVRARLTRTFERLGQLLEHAIMIAQRMGEIGPHKDSGALSRFLLCTIEGMSVLGKTGRSHQEMIEIVDVAMTALD